MLIMKNPPSLATGRVSNWVVDFQPTPDQIAESLADLNHFRARHIARCYRLAPLAAGLVAELAFHVEARG
jgi:hypothetical protein